MFPIDLETRQELTELRAEALIRSAEAAMATVQPARARQRFGLWLVGIGVRLACDGPTVPSRA
jgi:hypothetical protein